jgi:hypothetical protein
LVRLCLSLSDDQLFDASQGKQNSSHNGLLFSIPDLCFAMAFHYFIIDESHAISSFQLTENVTPIL